LAPGSARNHWGKHTALPQTSSRISGAAEQQGSGGKGRQGTKGERGREEGREGEERGDSLGTSLRLVPPLIT